MPVQIMPQQRGRQRRRGDRGSGLSQYFDYRGPSMCWTPSKSYTQSSVHGTTHYFRQRTYVGLIDCMVGAVVEQVYSGAVT